MPAPEIAVAYVSIVPSLAGFQQTLRKQVVGPSADAGEEAGQSMSSKLSDGLKKGAAGAALAAGALIAKGLADAVEQANITSKLQAQLGASGKDASRYGKVAGKLYSAGVSESFESAAEAIKSVMQSGIAPPGATNAQLQSIATKASDLASTFDQDLGGVTNAVAQMIRTGLAKNSTEAFDILTKGFQSGADKAGDLLDTMNEYGTQFRKAGIDGSQAVGLINQALQNGARDGDLAADAIKEFSIRAIDGSDTTKQGFQALGLSATDMAAKFGKGGKTANAALDLTLDRLRGMKDPVAQSAAATALFGSQAEDLGKALFAMDPSKAAAGLGKVGGAADKMGKSLRSGPTYELQVFTRRIQQGLTEALGTYVIPALTKVGGAINTYFVPALRKAWDIGKGTFSFLKDAAPWLAPLAIAIGGVTLALNAQKIAWALTTGVFSVYRAAILIGTAVTNGFAGAQALLNAVMSLNPITLVVIAIAALVAAIVVAYNKSETFRAIVQGAWQGIQAAISFAWNNVIKPVLSALGAAFSWLYNNVVKPVWAGIQTAIQIAIIPIQAALSIIWFAIKAVGAVFAWLWNNAVKPALGWIADKALWLWTYGIKPGFDLLKKGLSALGDAFKWLWDNGVKPVLNWISEKAQWLWTYGIKPGFDAIKRGLTVLKNAFKWLWDNGVKPVLNWISDKAKWVWNNGIKPSFDAIKNGVKKVGDSFKTAKDFIGDQWSKLQEIGKKPVRFLINTVYNGGIVPLWNKIATAFGAPSLKPLNIKGYATGGILPGYTPGRDVHLAALSGGEAIMRPEWTRAMGPGYVNAMNGLARRGGVGAIQKATNGGLPAFKDGGIFGWIGSAANTVKGWGSAAWDKVKDGASWLKDGLESSARAGVKYVVKPLLSRIPGINTGFGKMVKNIPDKILNTIFGYSKKADSKGAGGNVGNPPGSGVNRWRSTVIKALAANGLSTSDSMVARVLRQIATESGGNPKAVQGNIGDINNRTGDLAKGLMQTISATFNAYKLPGHGNIFNGYDNLLAALNYAKHRYGPSLSFLGNGHGYDNGGWLQPGAGMTVNATGKPEPVFTNGQWSLIQALAARGASADSAGGLRSGDRLVLVTGSGTEFEAYVDQRADTRIHEGLTAPAALGRTL
ncbi:phage tail tape measure protein [Streptomyces lydicus]|uniref:phage tail tape measure protein n=1 Tax=Streptomyces lydicus TaxID=47763 RepID=UPI0036E7317F